MYLLHVENTNAAFYKFNVDRRIIILCTSDLKCRNTLILVLNLKTILMLRFEILPSHDYVEFLTELLRLRG
jgi:hypothetical protein